MEDVVLLNKAYKLNAFNSSMVEKVIDDSIQYLREDQEPLGPIIEEAPVEEIHATT
jgi:hypothetical protein